MTKQKAMSVYINSETLLGLNRLREEIRQKNESESLPIPPPTIGWLARTLLRQQLGLSVAKNDSANSL